MVRLLALTIMNGLGNVRVVVALLFLSHVALPALCSVAEVRSAVAAKSAYLGIQTDHLLCRGLGCFKLLSESISRGL